MTEYHKIQSLFKRDMKGNKKLIVGEWALPEFEYLQDNKWLFTEKVDGTNIRIIWDGDNLTFGGRTDRANIPAILVNWLNNHVDIDWFKKNWDGPATLYGEGYGAKIQKGGGNYSSEQKFVLFDVLVGELWLERHNVEDIASQLNIECVPIIYENNLRMAADFVATGFNSRWGDFPAEGLVGRPATELQNRRGHRIITKIKTKDFA